jgi:hypothetical protein
MPCASIDQRINRLRPPRVASGIEHVDWCAIDPTPADALFGRYLLLRKGKRSYAVLQIVG